MILDSWTFLEIKIDHTLNIPTINRICHSSVSCSSVLASGHVISITSLFLTERCTSLAVAGLQAVVVLQNVLGCAVTCTVRKPTYKRTEPWCYFLFYFKFISMMVCNFNDWKKSILWLLISCSFKLLWRLVHIRSHWHSYILSLISRNIFNYDTSLICFYFFLFKI